MKVNNTGCIAIIDKALCLQLEVLKTKERKDFVVAHSELVHDLQESIIPVYASVRIPHVLELVDATVVQKERVCMTCTYASETVEPFCITHFMGIFLLCTCYNASDKVTIASSSQAVFQHSPLPTPLGPQHDAVTQRDAFYATENMCTPSNQRGSLQVLVEVAASTLQGGKKETCSATSAGCASTGNQFGCCAITAEGVSKVVEKDGYAEAGARLAACVCPRSCLDGPVDTRLQKATASSGAEQRKSSAGLTHCWSMLMMHAHLASTTPRLVLLVDVGRSCRTQ